MKQTVLQDRLNKVHQSIERETVKRKALLETVPQEGSSSSVI